MKIRAIEGWARPRCNELTQCCVAAFYGIFMPVVARIFNNKMPRPLS